MPSLASPLRRCEVLLEDTQHLLDAAAALDASPPWLEPGTRAATVSLLEHAVAEVGALLAAGTPVPIEQRLWELRELEDELMTALAFHGWSPVDEPDDALPPLLTERLDGLG